jgi:hypothetical protein
MNTGAKIELRKRFESETGKVCYDNIPAYSDWIEEQLIQQDKADTVTAWVEQLEECWKMSKLEGFSAGYPNFKEWLSSIQLPIQGYSLKEVEDAFDAGMEHEYEKHYGAIPPTSPNKEQYIKSLKQ